MNIIQSGNILKQDTSFIRCYTNVFPAIYFIIFAILSGIAKPAFAQKKNYKPKIEICDCRFKVDSGFIKTAPANLKSAFEQPFDQIDSSFKTRCGYLIVPENRLKPTSKMIKLPFIVVESKNPNKKKDPLLYTSGGPGNSSLGWAIGMTRGEYIKDRDCIVIEQRGTRYAIPHLRTFVLDSMIRASYRYNLPKDSMFYAGVNLYRKQLEAKGIDISGYNSYESVSDIHDLLKVLQIDSVNLMGGSYSGGLMMAALQKDPSKIRSLVMDSPLPMFSPIDEDEPANYNEALDVLFRHVEKDSTDKVKYGNLKQRFQTYFNSLVGKTFYQSYLEKGTRDSLKIQYTKNELLSAIEGAIFDDGQRRDVAYMITEMIKGHHSLYVKNKLDNVFNKNQAPDGMRMSVYCADEAAYHSEEVIRQLYQVYPYMAGYHINDVYKAVCDCWEVPPVNPVAKQHFYSATPVWVGDGEMDPGCRPGYMDQIHHYMPNTQRFLFINKAHGVGGKAMTQLVRAFLEHPYQKVTSSDPDIIAF
jgi:pimeloyl-ACP methyl ester carboxylesterase